MAGPLLSRVGPGSCTAIARKPFLRSPCVCLHRPKLVRTVVSERLSGSANVASSATSEDELPEDASSSVLSSSDTSSSCSTSSSVAEDAARLFDSSHLPSFNPLLLLYAPIGACLAVFRMACWIAGILLDQPWFRNKWVVDTYLKLLGFRSKWTNEQLLPKGYHVMVSNHTTSGDLMALFQRPHRYTHLITTAMPGRVTSTKHLPLNLQPASPEIYDKLAQAASESGSEATPVHVFPEGGLTNGSGMLQFSRGFMKFVPRGTPVVPVALTARNPLNIRTHTLTSSFLANLFWFSFCPWVEIDAVVLPPMVQEEGEGRGQFVQRVQAAIAAQLGVPVSDMTIQQKRALMKAATASSGKGAKAAKARAAARAKAA